MERESKTHKTKHSFLPKAAWAAIEVRRSQKKNKVQFKRQCGQPNNYRVATKSCNKQTL